MVMEVVNRTAITLLVATTAVVTQDTPKQDPTALVSHVSLKRLEIISKHETKCTVVAIVFPAWLLAIHSIV